MYTHNGWTGNRDANAVLGQATSTGADLIVLCEVNAEVVRAAIAGVDGYPELERLAPEPGVHGWVLVLSRYPMRPIQSPEMEGIGVVAVRVEHAVPVDLVALHTPSPRSRRRWKHGLGGVQRLAAWIDDREGVRPVVVAGDLNGGPRSARGRLIRRTLDPSQGWLDGGTFPAAVPGFARLVIDGVWTDDRLVRSSRTVLPAAGSDHAALLVTLSER
ncbi:MAG: endonuclease/exonuclease/phosphatase family protein [Planctomycetota bacterium]